MSNQLSRALALAGLGFRVFPVHTPGHDGCSCRTGPDCTDAGKHPRISRYPAEATGDPRRIRAWWGRWGDANIGIATGGGLIVVDVDSEEGLETFRRLAGIKDNGMPGDTPVVRTGSGGFHIYYRTPPGRVACNRQKQAGAITLPGVDIRGEGGFVVGPGSVHRSGERYECLTRMDGLANLPAALAGILTEPGPSGAPEASRGGCVGGNARGAAYRFRAPRTPKEGHSEASRARGLGCGAGRLARQMVERYPITAPGQRSERVREVVWYLARTDRPASTIRRIGLAYLEHFEGVYATPLPGAVDLLEDLIERTVAKFSRGERTAVGQHHHVARAMALGESWRVDLLTARPSQNPCPPNPSSSPGPAGEEAGRGERVRGTRNLLAGRSDQERAFVHGVLSWVLYKLLKFSEPEILITDRQLMDMCGEWGCPIEDRRTIKRLRAKYFRQGSGQASVLELLVRTSVGCRRDGEGIPSRYLPSEALADLLLHDAEGRDGAGWCLEDEGRDDPDAVEA